MTTPVYWLWWRWETSSEVRGISNTYWIQYTNIVDRKSGPFGGNLDKNAKNWLEQGALAIFWRFLTPGNKWCLDWSWFQTIYPIPIFDILFPFPVTKSQSQWLKSHFPRAKTGQSQFPFYPFRTPCCGSLTLFLSWKLLLLLFERSAPILIQQTIWEWSENMFGCFRAKPWTEVNILTPLIEWTAPAIGQWYLWRFWSLTSRGHKYHATHVTSTIP